MSADTAPVELTEDEWRDQKFSEEQQISAKIADARLGKTTLAQLKAHMARFGPDGILESATSLPREQYEELEKLVRKQPKTKTVTPRKSRR